MLSVGRRPEVCKRDNWVVGVHLTDAEQAEFWLQIPLMMMTMMMIIIIIIPFLLGLVKEHCQQLCHVIELILKWINI